MGKKIKLTGSKPFVDGLVVAGSFVVIFTIVHLFYYVQVDKMVEVFNIQKEKGLIPEDSVSMWVIIKDVEQKWIFILGIFAAVLIALRRINMNHDLILLNQNLLGIGSRDLLHRDKIDQWIERLEDSVGSLANRLLPQALRLGLDRFKMNGSVEEVSNTVTGLCDSESVKCESELAWINYLAWAIPSIGFIGTVRGIGGALAKAGAVFGSDDGITPVTNMLGVAFNSTLVALVVSIGLMFMVHWIRRLEERTILQTEKYCSKYLIEKLYQPQA